MIARRISAQLRAPIEVRATQLEVSPQGWHSHSWLRSSNQWTGRLTSDHMSHKAKSQALKTAAATHNLDLAQSYAYGNSTADVPMLESVAHPQAVNPSRRLARVAQQNNWPTSHWTRSSPKHLKFTRSAPRPEDLAMNPSTQPTWSAAACRRLAYRKFGAKCPRSPHKRARHSSITFKKGTQL